VADAEKATQDSFLNGAFIVCQRLNCRTPRACTCGRFSTPSEPAKQGRRQEPFTKIRQARSQRAPRAILKVGFWGPAARSASAGDQRARPELPRLRGTIWGNIGSQLNITSGGRRHQLETSRTAAKSGSLGRQFSRVGRNTDGEVGFPRDRYVPANGFSCCCTGTRLKMAILE
jgi:ribosomal protein S16